MKEQTPVLLPLIINWNYLFGALIIARLRGKGPSYELHSTLGIFIAHFIEFRALEAVSSEIPLKIDGPHLGLASSFHIYKRWRYLKERTPMCVRTSCITHVCPNASVGLCM